MSRDSLLVVSRAVTTVTAALLLIDIGLTVADTTIDGGDVQFVVTFAVGVIAMGVIGAVLSSRAPSNPIGWLVSTSQCAILRYRLYDRGRAPGGWCHATEPARLASE